MLAAHTLIHRAAQILHNAMKPAKPFMSKEKFKMVNCAYIYCMMNCGIILCKHIYVRVFKVQKNIIAIITGGSSGISCRDLLKILKFLSVQSQYTGLFKIIVGVCNNLPYTIHFR
jgi:hypothetical protein